MYIIWQAGQMEAIRSDRLMLYYMKMGPVALAIFSRS